LSVGLRISNLAIRTKILLSFSTVLILLVGLGLNALQRSSAMDVAIESITGNYALAVVYLDEMRVSISDYRGGIARELSQGEDKTAIQNTASVLTGLAKTYDENDAKYAPTVDPGTEATLYVEVKAAWSAYVAMSRHFHELLAADKAMEAKTYFLSDMVPAGTRAEAAVHANMAYNIAAF
jgi:methyl-accepting chemotaxis protein